MQVQTLGCLPMGRLRPPPTRVLPLALGLLPGALGGYFPSGALRKSAFQDMRTLATKETYIYDLRDSATGHSVKPMQRAARDMNLTLAIQNCSKWQQVKQLVDEMSEKYERDAGLCVETLVKLSDLLGNFRSMNARSKNAILEMLDTVTTLLTAKLNRLRSRHFVPLMFALEELDYPAADLLDAVMGCLQLNPKQCTVAELMSISASCVALGHRPSQECVDTILNQAERGMKFATGDDLSNAAFAFSRLGKSTIPFHWMTRLTSQSLRHIDDMSADGLAHLVLLISKTPDFYVDDYWLEAYERSLVRKLRSIRNPRSYPALLYGLDTLGMKLSQAVMKEVLAGLSTVPPETQVLSSSDMSSFECKSSPAADTGSAANAAPLYALEPEDLGVVTTVIANAAVKGHKPSTAFLSKLVDAVEAQAGDMEPSTAAVVLYSLSRLIQTSPPEVYEYEGEASRFSALADELLAVMESGLKRLSAAQLELVVTGLKRLGHNPDCHWIQATRTELMQRATTLPRALNAKGKAHGAATLETPEELVALAAMAVALQTWKYEEDDKDVEEAKDLTWSEEQCRTFAKGLVVHGKTIGGVSESEGGLLLQHMGLLGVQEEIFEIPIVAPKPPPETWKTRAARAGSMHEAQQSNEYNMSGGSRGGRDRDSRRGGRGGRDRDSGFYSSVSGGSGGGGGWDGGQQGKGPSRNSNSFSGRRDDDFDGGDGWDRGGDSRSRRKYDRGGGNRFSYRSEQGDGHSGRGVEAWGWEEAEYGLERPLSSGGGGETGDVRQRQGRQFPSGEEEGSFQTDVGNDGGGDADRGGLPMERSGRERRQGGRGGRGGGWQEGGSAPPRARGRSEDGDSDSRRSWKPFPSSSSSPATEEGQGGGRGSSGRNVAGGQSLYIREGSSFRPEGQDSGGEGMQSKGADPKPPTKTEPLW